MTKKVGSLINITTSTERSTAKNHNRHHEKKLYRTPFEYHLQLFKQISNEIKYLKPKSFKNKLKRTFIEFKPDN